MADENKWKPRADEEEEEEEEELDVAVSGTRSSNSVVGKS